MRRERLYLKDILAAADAVTGFIETHTGDSFAKNLMLRSAVVHQMTVIGEAVSRLSPELRGRYPAIPWTDIKGFRNIVVHNYFGIDWSEVWRAATRDVPALRQQIAEILGAEFPERAG